jgi:hypothetical protein
MEDSKTRFELYPVRSIQDIPDVYLTLPKNRLTLVIVLHPRPPCSNHLGTNPHRSDAHNVPRRTTTYHAASWFPAASDTLPRSASRSAPRMIASPHFRIGRSAQLVYGGRNKHLSGTGEERSNPRGDGTLEGWYRQGRRTTVNSLLQSADARPWSPSAKARHNMSVRGAFARATASFYVIALPHLHAAS